MALFNLHLADCEKFLQTANHDAVAKRGKKKMRNWCSRGRKTNNRQHLSVTYSEQVVVGNQLKLCGAGAHPAWFGNVDAFRESCKLQVPLLMVAEQNSAFRTKLKLPQVVICTRKRCKSWQLLLNHSVVMCLITNRWAPNESIYTRSLVVWV